MQKNMSRFHFYCFDMSKICFQMCCGCTNSIQRYVLKVELRQEQIISFCWFKHQLVEPETAATLMRLSMRRQSQLRFFLFHSLAVSWSCAEHWSHFQICLNIWSFVILCERSKKLSCQFVDHLSLWQPVDSLIEALRISFPAIKQLYLYKADIWVNGESGRVRNGGSYYISCVMLPRFQQHFSEVAYCKTIVKRGLFYH